MTTAEPNPTPSRVRVDPRPPGAPMGTQGLPTPGTPPNSEPLSPWDRPEGPFDANNPTGGGNFNPDVHIDTSMATSGSDPIPGLGLTEGRPTRVAPAAPPAPSPPDHQAALQAAHDSGYAAGQALRDHIIDQIRTALGSTGMF